MMDLSEDREKLFYRILEELQQEFPPGTVEGDGMDAKIPPQAYIDRINRIAGPYCSIHDKGYKYIPEFREVSFTVTIEILGVKRDGTGIQTLSKNAKSLRTAIAAAKSNAIRDAANEFQMGWKDLASHKEWGGNPGITLLSGLDPYPSPLEKHSESSRSKLTCIIPTCGKVLNTEDHKERDRYEVTQNYCKNHIPDHFKRNAIKNGLINN